MYDHCYAIKISKTGFHYLILQVFELLLPKIFKKTHIIANVLVDK